MEEGALIEHKKSTSGIAYPDDLCLLKRAYDQICLERDLPAGSPAAEQLAIRAMELFAQGIFEEEALLQGLRQPA